MGSLLVYGRSRVVEIGSTVGLGPAGGTGHSGSDGSIVGMTLSVTTPSASEAAGVAAEPSLESGAAGWHAAMANASSAMGRSLPEIVFMGFPSRARSIRCHIGVAPKDLIPR